MITGRNQLSQEIIKNLTDKTIKVKDVPKRYDVSLDQAKRLSRYLKITLAANKHLSESVNRKVHLMGLKVLALADLFKNEDWEGLEEILSSVNENITRDQLKQMVLSLEEKRERIQAFLEETKFKIKYLEESRKDARKAENKTYFAPSSPYYKKGVQLIGESLLQKIEQAKEDLKKTEEQIKETEKEIQDLRKISVKSFSEAVLASNMLSAKEIQKHGELQYKAGKWLYSKGYVVGFEVTLPNGRRVDVAGFNENREIIFVEVKASDNDFQNDNKWKWHLLYCDKFYFLGN